MCLTGSATLSHYCSVLRLILRQDSCSSMVRFHAVYASLLLLTSTRVVLFQPYSSHPAVLVPISQHDLQNETVRISQAHVPRRHRRFSQGSSSNLISPPQTIGLVHVCTQLTL